VGLLSGDNVDELSFDISIDEEFVSKI